MAAAQERVNRIVGQLQMNSVSGRRIVFPKRDDDVVIIGAVRTPIGQLPKEYLEKRETGKG